MTNPWSRVLPNNQLMNKFFAFYESQKFIAMVTISSHGTVGYLKIRRTFCKNFLLVIIPVRA
jgi:hypothetical protein